MDTWKSSSGWHQEAKSPQWAELKKTIRGYQRGFWIYVQKRKFAKGLGTLVKANSVVTTWQGKKEPPLLLHCFLKFLHLNTTFQFPCFYFTAPLRGRSGPYFEENSLSSVHPHLNSASFLGLLLRMTAGSGVCGVREPKPRTAGATEGLPLVPCRSSDSASWQGHTPGICLWTVLRTSTLWWIMETWELC